MKKYKIASLSDLHLDINGVYKNNEGVLAIISACNKLNIDVLLLSGDTSQDIKRTSKIVEKLNASMDTVVYFIAGNHERYLNKSTHDDILVFSSDYYINNKSINLPDSNITIVGFNGWYDYTLKDSSIIKADESYQNERHKVWSDPVDFSLNDIDATKLLIDKFKVVLEDVLPDRDIILLTHFIPKKEFVVTKPGNYPWNLCNAYMGSSSVGELIDSEDRIKHVILGHTHKDFGGNLHLENKNYSCRPIGYCKHGEWETSNIKDEILHKINILEFD